nr:TonB-dependent receptor [Sphingomonas sp. CDS-1]
MRTISNLVLRTLLVGTAAAAITALSGGAALAEDQAADKDSAVSVNEIIVQARRREESLQNVPVVVTALNAATLARNAVSGYDSLATITPGLRIFSSGNQSAQGAISLRGIQTGSINLASDQAVALNLDGVQIDSGLGIKAGFFDVDQVEILKGPQALYFGKNSSGGVISIKSADPTDTLFLQGRGGYEFNARERYGEVIASGPLSSELGARLGVYYSNMDGFFKNLSPSAISNRAPNGSELIARGTILWKPSDRFEARLKLTYANRDFDQFAYSQKIRCFNPAATKAECTRDHNVSQPAPIDVLNRFSSDDPFSKSNLYLASLNLTYELSDNLSLASTTGFYRIRQSFFDSVNPRADTDFFILPANPNEILYQSRDEIQNLSQEIRLTSDFSGPFNFMLGGFVDSRHVQSDAKLSFGATAVPENFQRVRSHAYSFFGEISYDILPTVQLSGGARYTNERRRYDGKLLEKSGPFGPGSPLTPSDDVLKQDNLSPEASITWRPTNEVTVFGAYKRGFKSGSFDISAISNLSLLAVPREIRFGSERAEGFEAGIKTLLFDRQLRVNAAAYRYKYKGLQANAFDSDTATTRVLNAAAATTKGVEIEAQYAPNSLRGLVFNAALNYNKAQYDDFITDCNQTQVFARQCPLDLRPPVGPESQNLAGAPLKTAPRWSATWGAALSRPLTDSTSFRAGWTFAYSSSYQTEDRNDPLGVQKPYLTINANLGVSGANDRWSLDLIGTNLTDELFMVTSNSQPFTGVTGLVRQDYFANVDRGRQVRLQLTIRN